MSTTDSPTKSWWSLSKASGSKELHHNYSDVKSAAPAKSASGLKSLAVAIGLKPKKPSREPLSPTASSRASDTTSGPKSTSSTFSPVDSLGPYTPFDTRLQRSRQSLLTLADDPFAGHPPLVFVRRSPVPNRLSGYSSPSVTDLVTTKSDSPVHRSSYASSSTNSNSLALDLNATAISNPRRVLPERNPRLRRSISSVQLQLLEDLEPNRISRSKPSAEAWQPMGDQAYVRSKLRARGMTVAGPPPKSGFFVKEQRTQRKLSSASAASDAIPSFVMAPEPSSKPSFIFRQSSLSSARLVSPPTAPPTVGLPAPPPTIPEQPNFRQRKGLNSLPPSLSSSMVSNMSLLSPIEDDRQTSQRTLPAQDHSVSENVVPSAPRTLKKHPSQRSFRPPASPSASMISKTTSTPDASEKRKQRNSQQSRLPMPALSLSIRTSLVPTSSQPPNGDASLSSVNEQRKSRKRLFSNCQRPSTSTCVPTDPREDDSLSVLSLRSDHDTICTPYKPWLVTRNYPSPSSFWDESFDTTPSSPVVDYQPQAIMSRDELAELEAQISNDKTKNTSLDFTSSFPPSNGPEVVEQEPSQVGVPPSHPVMPGRRSSDATFASFTSRSGSPSRPVTADSLARDRNKEAEIDTDSRRRVANPTSTQLDTNSTSLPPPPRRRILSSSSIRSTASTSTLTQTPVERINFSKIKPLDRPNTAITTTSLMQPSGVSTNGSLTSTPPVSRPRSASRGKTRISGLEKAIHHRSIMRKPSFLEIDGDSDPESEPEVVEKRDSLFLNMNPPSANGSSKTGESFLDFAQESFDAVRS